MRAAFLDNEGVFGQGERRVCPQWTSGSYTLSVLLMDGSQDDRIVTVELRPDTPTPTPTPTFTPVLTPTPTWTPDGGAVATALPNQFAVQLAVDGGNQRTCAAGQLCEAVVQVGNRGTLADEIFVDLAKDSPWPVQLCRADGLCGETSISIGVGPGNQLPIFVRVQIPPDGAGQSYAFQVSATSGNSNRTVQAEPVSLTLTAQ